MSVPTEKNSRAAIAASRDYKRYAADLYADYVEDMEQRSTSDLLLQALARGLRAGAPASRQYLRLVAKIAPVLRGATSGRRGINIVLARSGGDNPVRPVEAPGPRSVTPPTAACKPPDPDPRAPAADDLADVLGVGEDRLEMLPFERSKCLECDGKGRRWISGERRTCDLCQGEGLL